MPALTCTRVSSASEIDLEVVGTVETAAAMRSASQIPVKGSAPKNGHHRRKKLLARGAHGRRGGGADQAGPHTGVPPAPTPHGKATTPIARAPRGPDCQVASHLPHPEA